MQNGVGLSGKLEGITMKLSYFGYHFERHQEQDRFLADIRPILRAFSDFENPEYKNRFTHEGENLYLFRRLGDLYMFLITRDREIIKGIRNDDLTVSEIQDILAAEGESIGFASYVYVKRSYFGFASTVMAPRFQTFASFINSVLRSVNCANYQFIPTPLLQQTARNIALEMRIHGAATFELDAESTLARDIGEQFHMVNDDFGAVASMQVRIVPKYRQNIRDATAKLIQHLPEDGLQKFTVKAKNDVNEKLTELYLADKGHISDDVRTRDEPAMAKEIQHKAAANQVLADKVQEHEQDEKFEDIHPQFIDHLSDAADWPDRVVDL